jgi:predicted Zn-dependent protease
MAEKPTKKPFKFEVERLGPGSDPVDVYQLQSLLSRLGYLREPYNPEEFDYATRRAVAQFQNFYRIFPKEDGICDQETIDLLNIPRCGVPDPSPAHRDLSGRLSSYVTVGAKWQRNLLTYRFLNETPDLELDRQRAIITEAFNRWRNVSALEFEEVGADETSDISVSFHHRSHGDGYPFDDAGGADGNTLAHAFFPPPAGGTWAGSLHFDEYEFWKDEPGGPGIRLYNVALHEIGHLLGLAHSQDENAIMYAYYAEDRNDLRADDIAGIQSLYGTPQPDPVAIFPGQPVNGHLPGKDAEARYQVTLQNKLLIRLDGPDDEDFDLYIRYGEPAGREQGQYDTASYGITSDELVTIDNPKSGSYYILVHSYKGSGNYSLEVEVV